MKFVSKSPLKAKFGDTNFKFSVSQPEPHQLRLVPNLGGRVVAWSFCVLGWPILLLGLIWLFGLFVMIAQNRLESMHVVAALCLLVWGFPVSFVGVFLLGRRFRFDRQTGEMTVRFFWRTRRRPLTDIVAVQVISGTDAEGDISNQLNLVLDDPSEPRLFVTDNDDKDMAKKAKLLADFLEVPLLVENQMGERDYSDTTRHWETSDEPLPPFDLAAGALGGFTLGSNLEQAEFLGRPDPVEQDAAPLYWYLNYAGRGFNLTFEKGQFVALYCTIALHSADASPKPGQGFSRPRLSGGIVLTPETSLAQVLQYFGPPASEENYTRGKALTYHQGGLAMEFEFEHATERLLDWSVRALDD